MPTAANLADTKASNYGFRLLPRCLGGQQKEHDYLYWEFHEYGKFRLLIENHKALRGLGKEVLLYD